MKEYINIPSSLVYQLVIRYADDAPGVRAFENNICCCNCKHIYQDAEIDECKKHPGMYHDWDMPDSENFAYSLVCNDFSYNAELTCLRSKKRK